ncbi:uncharacterized mitochondrial protein AtMg00810-like [Amaranthus tricolor]|uniref:uncharacterized mitochondrial protein AtMg00810-like n=1 Tax=Amaranthus tricolor TaxID=29722 RepID=UPI00258685ED|nr:uncharacterized mitochondrial protein AtMg00810-like [Amaranthus tricolor]
MELFNQGFEQSKNDYSLFINKTPTSITIAAVYVDDILLTGNNHSIIQSLKAHLHHIFSIKDLGRLNYFLGFEVTYLNDGIVLSQQNFTTNLKLPLNLKPIATPLPLNLKLQTNNSPLFHDPTHYGSLVGKLNFLTHTRPDFSYTIQALSQLMQNPIELHFQALTHTLNYVASTLGQGILLQSVDNLKLHAYSDSDWGACLDTRRSITGYVILFGNSLVS